MNARFVMFYQVIGRKVGGGDTYRLGLVHHRMKVATRGSSLDFNRKFGWMDFMQISTEH